MTNSINNDTRRRDAINCVSTPKLRFPEFEGEWEDKKLGHVVSSKSGKYNPEKEFVSVRCIELEHLASETGQLLGYIDGKNSGSIKNKFQTGDVLFGKLRPYLKKYLQAPFDGVCSSEIWVLKGEGISNDFLYRIVQTDKFIELANQSSGSKMPRADWAVVSSGLFNFPTLPEQTKIANFLTAVDDKLTHLKKKKSLLEQYKKGVMQRIFSGFDTDAINRVCTNENPASDRDAINRVCTNAIRFKDENGEDFAEWEEKKLGEIGKFFSGGTPLTTKREFFNGEIPFIRSGEINSDKTEQFITELGLKNSSAKMVEIGDLIYALYGATSGEVAISKIKGAINQAILCIRTDEVNKFLYYYLWLNKEIIIKTYLQGGQGNLSADIIKSISVPIPSIEEQSKIANFLSAIDDKINHCGVQIEKMEGWKKGLLQRMFV